MHLIKKKTNRNRLPNIHASGKMKRSAEVAYGGDVSSTGLDKDLSIQELEELEAMITAAEKKSKTTKALPVIAASLDNLDDLFGCSQNNELERILMEAELTCKLPANVEINGTAGAVDIVALLKAYFGYDKFRSGQAEVSRCMFCILQILAIKS